MNILSNTSPNPIRHESTTAKRRVLQLILLAGLFSLGAQVSVAATLTVGPSSTYPTIQSAVTAAMPGDTILLEPGIYNENLTIDKRVILKGTGSGDDPETDSIIQSFTGNTPVITLTAGGDDPTDRLVIQDLRVTGASGSSSHAGSGITLQPLVQGYLTFENVTVVENSGNGIDIDLFALLTDIVIRNSTLSQNGGSGFRAPASSLGINGLEVANSHFDSNLGGGFTAYSVALTNWNIHDSTFNDNVGPDVAPYTGGYGMYIQGHIVQDVTIDCSYFSRNRGTDPDNNNNFSSGLVLFPAAPGDIYSNITIKSSHFDDNPFAGILVQPVLGSNMNNIALECVGIERNGYGIVVFAPGDITGFSIHNSNIAGNTSAGIYTDNATTIDATANWWNSPSGPTTLDNPGGTGDAIVDDGAGSVTFIPFLTAPSPCASTCAPRIKIVKMTNGTNNDVPPGPTVPVGSTVNWTYEVTNTGNEPLSNVIVTDNRPGVIVSCPGNTLAIGASMTCMASGTAVAGQYSNIGSVTGTPPTGSDVTDSNPDHYFGQKASISIVKKTNGTNNDSPPGPTVTVGSTVTWTYFVTNTGNVPLTNVTVTDDKVGFICTIGTLAPGATAAPCTKTGPATAGQYINYGTATGKPPTGPNVTATNVDHYFGQATCPAPGTISFTGNTSTSGATGNVRTFSGAGVNVHASAFSRTRSGGAWNTAYLGSYSGGLGVTDTSEGSGGNNTHKIDNIGGRDNYVLLEFSSPVVIDKAFLDSVGADSDVSVWIGTKTNPFNSHQTLSDGYFSGLYMEENSTPDVTPGSRWADLNATQRSGNVIVIAALTSDLHSPEDAFKLSKVTLGCPPPPVCAAGTFYFSGNTATSGTAGNIRTFTVNGVTVNVSAFSKANSGAWATSYLGLYSGGLGVTDASEGSGGNNTHKVDNVGSQNNYVLFEFSAPVIVDRAYLDIIGADSDMSAWFGTKPDPINNHLTLSDALLSSLGVREDNMGSNVARWANINTGNVKGNVFVLSALVGDPAYNDAFKISKVEIKCQ